MKKLTDNFAWSTAAASDYADRFDIDNSIPEDIKETIEAVTAPKMEMVRAVLGHPVLVSSWYRSQALNRAVGGSQLSQHRLGLAVDFRCPGFGTPLAVAQELELQKFPLGIDQLIWEYSWVHISFTIPTVTPRYQMLTYQKSPAGKAVYLKGIISNESAAA